MQIKNKIETIETNKILPELKKKYEGKYFKFKNSYGSDTEESWFIYQRVEKVNDADICHITSIQDDKKGRIEFEIDKYYHVNMLQVPITKKEFTDNYKKALNKIKSIAEKP